MVHNHRDVQGGAARAAVFGVSDGLVSNVALILGVAAASETSSSVVIAGISGLLAGAASMAAGEYVSMKAQNELIERELRIERESLAQNPQGEDKTLLTARMSVAGEPVVVQGSGSGSLDAFVQGLRESTGLSLRVLDYAEHAKGTGVDAAAVAYVQAKVGELEIWGCGMHTDITTASMRAIVSAMNRAANS